MTTATDQPRTGKLLLDTSAAIALLVVDHEFHSAVSKSVAERELGLSGHAWFETFSVLTRLPRGKRRSPAQALELLRTNFPATVFLEARLTAGLGDELAQRGIGGGHVYDALIAAAARAVGLPLLTADNRARPTYEGLGIEVEFVP